MKLGFVSEHFESGGFGPGIISHMADDPGGKSYGTYQLSKVTLLEYLRESSFKFYDSVVFSSTFDDEWLEIAKEYPNEFALDQHLYVTKKMYLPNILFAKSIGYNTGGRKIQESVFSIAVQHGKAKQIIKDAYVDNTDVDSQIRKLYEVRSAYVNALELTASLKQALLSRYEKELIMVLSIEAPRDESSVSL